MTSFASLKRNRATLTSKLTSELEKLNSSKSYEDDRFWKIFLDKTKANGFAVIRLLPAPKNEDVPWQRYFSHSLHGPGGYYIENCPTTIGKECPVCKANTALWDTGIESNKKIARDRKRKLTHVTNIYVLQDKKNPDAVGKVFLWEFGKKIFDKITETMQPEFEDKTPINPFELWDGADFSLRVKHVDGYWNYDTSTFSDPVPLLKGDDKKLEEVWNQEYSLLEFVDPKRFKPYAELEARFNKVIGNVAKTEEPIAEEKSEAIAEPKRSKSRKVKEEPVVDEAGDETTEVSEGNDDVLAQFAKLAEED